MNGPLILVPLDGTARARAALPIARVLGAILETHLHVLHVTPDPPPLATLADRLELAAHLPPAWSIDARTGDAAAMIIGEAVARQARLIVLCTYTATTPPAAILGRTALHVLQNAPCPVVVVPPDATPSAWWPERILLAYDGSAAAEAAVATGAQLACRARAELFVLQVGAARLATTNDRDTRIMPRYVDQPQHEWPSWRDEVLDRIASLCHDAMHARVRVLHGEPSREIVRMAKADDSLIVMSWKGAWMGERAGTLKGVLRDAPCPILVERADTRRSQDGVREDLRRAVPPPRLRHDPA